MNLRQFELDFIEICEKNDVTAMFIFITDDQTCLRFGSGGYEPLQSFVEEAVKKHLKGQLH
jgi:hypothetical protein